MFRSAATKLAHNTTIPALAGSKELRPLQDLIKAEKSCMVSIQHMSTEFNKAAEALRIWGAGEGDDLGDTLTSCTTLLVAFSNALATYASAHNVIRGSMKSIRTAEEALEELKRRRKSLHSKADAAERKLSKMNPEHKSLQVQTDLLNRLREEIRSVESDILVGETRLGDEKRRSVRMWMGVKWTGMGEFCEKGLITAEYGQSIIAEIPDSVTQPGLPRVAYHGHQKTQTLVAEAQHGIEGVGASGSSFTRASAPHEALSSRPGAELPALPMVYNGGDIELRYSPHPQGESIPPRSHGPFDSPDDQRAPGQAPTGPPPHQAARGTPPLSPLSYASGPQPPLSYPMPTPQPIYPSGSPQSGSSFLPSSTFETHTDQSLGSGHFMDVSDFSGAGSTFSASPMAPRQQRSESVDDFGTGMSGPTSTGPGAIGGKFATFPVKSRTPTGPPIRAEQSSDSSMLNPWDAEQELYQDSPGKRSSMVSDASSVGLAYDRSDTGMGPDERGGSDNKHVRFGAVSDVDEELERRQQQSLGGKAPNLPTVYSPSPTIHTPTADAKSPPNAQPQSSLDGAKSKEAQLGSPKSPHEPPPAYQDPDPSSDSASSAPIDPQEQERHLNAAVAREVSREFDALTFSPPTSDRQSDIGALSRGSPVSFDRARESAIAPDSSPLLPPNPAYASQDRSVSPTPQRMAVADVEVNVQEATPTSSRFTATPLGGPPSATPAAPSPQVELPPVPSQGLGIPGQYDGADWRDDTSQRTSSSYRTPPEYQSPRLGSRSASSSLSGGASPLLSLAPGTKTISAAAFRRPPPRKMSGDMLSNPAFAGGIGGNTMSGAALTDTSPLVLKKRLPGTPQLTRTPSPGGDLVPSPPLPSGTRAVSGPGGLQSQSSHYQQAQLPPIPIDDGVDEQFDYISAYVNTGSAESGSPPVEFGRVGRGGAGDVGGGPQGHSSGTQYRPPGGGYDQGRFATNLEDEAGLR